MKGFQKISKTPCEYEGQVIKNLRIANNISASKLSSFLNISVERLELIEGGEAFLGNGRQKSLAEFFKTTEKKIFQQ